MLVRLTVIGSLLLCAFVGTVGYFYFAEFASDSQPADAAAALLAKIEGDPALDANGTSTFQGHRWPISEGELFPDLTFTDADGNEVKLSQFKGKPIFVEAAAMSCGASVAFSGGEQAGAFKGIAPQDGLPPLEKLVQSVSKGFTLDDPRIVLVQILFFNSEMQTPTPSDLLAWRDHFKAARKTQPLLLAPPKGLPSGSTMPLVPGMFVVDRDFKVRYLHSGSSGDKEQLINLCRGLPRLADAPPSEIPQASDELVEKVAKAFLADQNPKLPFGAELPTNASRLVEIEAARKRNLYDLYRSDAPGAETWNDDALKCIHAMATHEIRAREYPSTESIPEANAAGKRAIKAGCDDPILLYCYAESMPLDQSAEEVTILRQALATMRERQYPREIEYRTAVKLLYSLWRAHHSDDTLRPELLEASSEVPTLFAKTVAESDLNPLQLELLIMPTIGMLGAGQPLHGSIWHFHDAVMQQPGIDPWVVDIISGTCHLEEAWRQRGGGYAHTVTEEGFHGFDEHCKAAAVCFATAWSRRPDNPIAARSMIRVMLSGQSVANESMRFWLIQAVKARFDDTRSYQAMLWSLRPRWFGSHDDMLSFGKECLDTKRFDTLVPYEFANAAVDVASELPEEERASFFASPKIATSLDALYAGLLADPSWNDEMRKKFRTEYAIVAYLADRKDISKEQVNELGGKLDPAAFEKFPVNPASFQQALGTLL